MTKDMTHDIPTTQHDTRQGEIILYQPDETVRLEVRLEDDTVWLTQQQMAELFQTTRNNVTLHIGNIFKEGELEESSVRKESLLTASDGKRYRTKFYNLDVIISVGYCVVTFESVSDKIIEVRGQKVILDFAVAELYGTETKEVNRAVKNNPGKFPDGWMFELKKQELEDLRWKNFTTNLPSPKILLVPWLRILTNTSKSH